MSDFFGSFRKKRGNGQSGATSPRSSIDSFSRKSQGATDTSEEPMPNTDEQIDELFDQMLVCRAFLMSMERETMTNTFYTESKRIGRRKEEAS